MKIQLYNRYHSNIWLENIKDNVWELKAKDKDDLSYLRVILNDDKSIYAIDPPGGPFLSIGTQVDNNYKIKEIHENFNIILDEVNNK